VGVGASDAVLLWNCAWGKVYLRARDGSAQKRHALAMYSKIRKNAIWHTSLEDDGRKIISDAIDSARLGDDSRLAQMVAGSCPK
jgi:hypothetical protein